MALPQRAFFTLHETASRWGCTIADIGGWATQGKLDIVTGIPVVTCDAEKVSGKLYAAYSSKAAAKAGDEASSYFAKEHARLERMLGSGSVGGSKAAEISRKLSVLSAFLPEEETATA